MKTKKTSYTFQIIWNLAGNFCFAIFTWLMSWILSKYYGEGNYSGTGILALATSYGNVFFVISSYGLRTFQVSDIKEKYKDGEYVAFRILTVALSTVLCVFISGFMGYSFLTFLCINLFVAYQSVRAYADVLYGILQKNEYLDKASKSLCLRAVAGLLAFISGVYLCEGVLQGILGLLFINVVITFLYDIPMTRNVYTGSMFPRQILTPKIFELLREGAPMMLYAILNPLTLSLPRIILEKYAGESLLGIFSLVFSPTVVIYTFATGILMPFIPHQAKYYYQHEYKKLMKSFLTPFLLISLVGVCGVVFCYLFGAEVLSLIYDKTIAKYTILLIQALIISTLSSLLACTGSILTATRKLYVLLTCNILGCVITAILSFVWIPEFNIYGASRAMLVGMLSQLIVTIVYIALILWFENKKK